MYLFWSCDPDLRWCGKTRVATYELLVASWKLKCTSWNSKLRVQTHEFKFTSYEFNFTSSDPRVRSSNPWVASSSPRANPVQDGPFWDCSQMGGRGGVVKSPPPVPNICHTHPTMVKLDTLILYLKKIKKYINHVTHPLSSADISIFCWKSANFSISWNTDIDFILIHYFKFF